MKEKKRYKNKWFEFTPGWSGLYLRYQLSGYYDTKPVIQIYFLWGKLFLYMPWTHYRKVERKKTVETGIENVLFGMAFGKRCRQSLFKQAAIIIAHYLCGRYRIETFGYRYPHARLAQDGYEISQNAFQIILLSCRHLPLAPPR